MTALAIAQSGNSTPPKKSAHSSTAAKTKQSTRAHATTKHTASRTSVQKTKSSRSKKGSKALKTAKKRGQQVIDPERARAIQEALIREHYMEGEPSGTWDSATQAAMQRYQADQGWQAKTTPDSRALIKLGLGPSNDHLLNPESAMTSVDPKPVTKPVPSDPAAPGTLPGDHPQR